MENATKALLMAGGVLLSLLVIGSLVMLFANLQDYQNKTDASVLETQIAKYNSQYEPYNKEGLTLMELKSVYNKIESNNKQYPEYKITTNIKDIYTDIDKEFNLIGEREKIERVFKCTNIKYEGKDGRISEILFEKTN